MSVQIPAEDRQRLLPEVLARSFNDLAIRAVGGAYVAFAAISWLSLISWQLTDPRVGQISGKATRNLLGPFGAGLSDLMVQTLGIAAIFAIACPMIWGLEMLSGVRWIPRMRIRIAAYCGALLTLAAFASGMPAVPGWPLPGGAGGMLGDIAYNIAISGLPSLGGERNTHLVLAALGVGGSLLLLKALGLGLSSLLRKIRIDHRTEAPTPVENATIAPVVSTPRTAPLNHRAPVAADTVSHPREPLDADVEGDDLDEETAAKARSFAVRFAPAVANGEVPAPRLLARAATSLRGRRGINAYRKPSLNLMRRGGGGQAGQIDVEAGARALHDVLAAYGVKGEIKEARPGPVVTRYELEPVRGTKLARVIGLGDDFARELGASAVRVSVTPGRTTIGIEVPNELRETVHLRDVLESDVFKSAQMHLPLAIGKGITGEPVVIDLARMPHLLMAGTTGSGKSVGLHAMLLSLVYKHTPAELRLLLIDPKMLELSPWDGIPHLLNPVITDATEAVRALDWAVAEMDERYKRMARHGVRSIDGFNEKVRVAAETGVVPNRTVHTGYDDTTGEPIYQRETLDSAPMPFIVIVIDELADLMVTSRQWIEGSVQRLAQKARAAGIHLVMATQRPSVDVITGTIKANLPVRMSYRVASKIDSRTIIGDTGADQLLGNGDLLLATGAGQLLRVHGAFVSDAEIGLVAEALRSQGEPEYVELTSVAAPAGAERTKIAESRTVFETTSKARDEATYASAVAVVAGERKASPGHLHRRMGLAEDVATRLIARMEAEGLVGPPNLIGRRTINLPPPASRTGKSRAA
jgi:S-DNA-T family DNA segregation ATPase FtsK/SpoIIIE